MTNFFDNVVYLARNTAVTLTELDHWSYFEFEMFLTSLMTKLEQEAQEAKKREREQAAKDASMRAQMRSYMQNYKK